MHNRPFAVYHHMVQKPPCWRANYPLGHPKQVKLSCFVLDVPVGSLLSSEAVFVPCDRKLQRAYYTRTLSAFPCGRTQYVRRMRSSIVSTIQSVLEFRFMRAIPHSRLKPGPNEPASSRKWTQVQLA